MRRYGAALTLALAAWLATLFLGAMLLTATRAAAAVGDLEFQGCLAMSPAPPGCTVAPGGVVGRAEPIAISPDGKSVYVVSFLTEGLTYLTRAEDGTLGFGSCLATPPAKVGCESVPNLPVRGSRGIAVSPDGAAVYVGSESLDAVSHFTRNPDTGNPAFSDCLTSAFFTFACELVEWGPEGFGAPLVGAWGLTAAPDGGSVYVAGTIFDTLSEVSPTGPAGEIAFSGCLANDVFHGCAAVPGGPFFTPVDVAVSPDGTSFHVISFGGSIDSFGRSVPVDGSEYLGCLGDDTVPGECDPIPAEALFGASDVAISADGSSLYTVARFGNVLTHFSRTPAGELAFEECFSSDELEGCVDVPGSPLLEAIGVAVAADGASVYVAALDSDAVIHFGRDEDGSLAYRECFAEATAAGGACAELPPGVMGGPLGIVTSPRGDSVYVTSPSSNTVVAFERTPAQLPEEPEPEEPGEDPEGEEPDEPEPDPEDPPSHPHEPQRPNTPDPGGPVLPTEPPPGFSCAGKPATITGTPRADTLRGTPRRDVIAGLGGADTIRGRGGNDLICGGAGKDRILGGPGRDRCTGGPGRDEQVCEPAPRRR